MDRGPGGTAPTLDSVESYIQCWIEDGEYIDADGQEVTDGSDEIEEDQKSKGRRVHFAGLVIVRPIPATEKGKPTPPRGRSVGGAKWRPDETANADAVDRHSDGASLAHGCVCGGFMVKGDGKHWAEADDDAQCLACAGQWHHRVQLRQRSRDIPIDAAGIAHEFDISNGPTTGKWRGSTRTSAV